MQKKCLEISCYVAGAGAFGVFLRWLQVQTSFNEKGLADRSVFHFLLPLFILAFGFVFLRFIDKARNGRYYLPEDLCGAFSCAGRLFTVARWACGGLMCIGALLVLSASETSKAAGLMRVLALLALLSGVAFPLLLAQSRDRHHSPGFACLLATPPILLYAVWTVMCYKTNSINSVPWAYAIELLTVIVAMLAFFRLAGFAYGVPRPWRSMFLCMAGAALCIMSLADDRELGLQIILLATGGMFILCNWIMHKNLLQREPEPPVHPEDGFERL